jgi:hypothetical protein
MFNNLLPQTTFDDVQTFCQQFPEGVRVEYKSDLVQIDKIVASLANTVGGLFVVGVRTDNRNMPVFPIEGIPAKKGIEEQVTQIAHTAIQPGLTPDVHVVDIPGKIGRVVVVVKVAESVDAPHAVDGGTRVYVRVGSTTPPYQLADVDRIEYLLKRRQEPERRREEIIQRMAIRSIFAGAASRLRVVVAPTYPRGTLVTMDQLIERAEYLQRTSTRLLSSFRSIHNGIRSLGSSPDKRQWHFEADTHGILFFEEEMALRGELQDGWTKQRVPYINLFNVTGSLGHVLNTAITLLAGAATNLIIRYELFGYAGIAMMYAHPGVPVNYIDGGGAVAMEHRCEDTHISVSTIATLETLTRRRVAISVELLRDVLYAFAWQPTDLEQVMYAVLKEQRLV